MVTHQAAIAVVGTVYVLAVGALGVWWAVTRLWSPKVRGDLSLFQIHRPIRVTSSAAAADVVTTCNAHGSCGADWCAPPIQVQRKIAES
jgi:hypothetical protein